MKRYSHPVAQLLNPALPFRRLCRSHLILIMAINRKYPSVHVALEMRYEYFAVNRDQVVSLGLKTKM